MKIEAKILSKKSLVEIVDIAIKENMFRENLIVVFYKHDLVTQLRDIGRQYEQVEKELKNKKLSRKACVVLVKKQARLTVIGNKKIDLYESFCEKYPDPKEDNGK